MVRETGAAGAGGSRTPWALAAICIGAFAFGTSVFGIAAGRPIIADGTVKTADGQLLRGCHAHIGRQSTAIVTFFTNLNNVIKMRDSAHLNVIRICCITPGWGSVGTVDQALSYADQIVNNCETAGIYAMMSYHGPISTSGDWDINSFWSKAAQHYKDKPFVIFNLVNEQVQCFSAAGGYQLNGLGMGTGNPAGWNFSPKFFGDLHKSVRALAPTTMIFGIEPVNMECDWSSWLKSQYAPYCGFTWTSGKDAFSFHPYTGSTGAPILATQAGGIPIINSEYSFRQEGWPMGDLEGTTCHAQFFEKYGISHVAWQEYQKGETDQLAAIMNYLVADAVAKGYAWWTFSTPTAPTNLHNTSTNQARVALAWNTPSSLGGGLMRYLVYRGGVQIGRAAGTTFIDSTVKAGASYRYEVSALGKGSLESPRSLPFDIGTVDIGRPRGPSPVCSPAVRSLISGASINIPAGPYLLRILDASGKTVLLRTGTGPYRCGLSILRPGVHLMILDSKGIIIQERTAHDSN